MRQGGDDKAGNPLYETNQSQLSAPDSPGRYAAPPSASHAQSQLSARSRQESAQEFPAANPLFTGGGKGLLDSDDDVSFVWWWRGECHKSPGVKAGISPSRRVLPHLSSTPLQFVDASGAVANPMYQSARATASGDDLMATADSMGGDYGGGDAAATTAAAASRPSGSGQVRAVGGGRVGGQLYV